MANTVDTDDPSMVFTPDEILRASEFQDAAPTAAPGPAPEPDADTMEIEFGGAILELPAGAPPEAVRRAIDSYRASPEFEKTIDKSSGAPARVRAIVGGAPPRDRLANIQRFYPDAIPFGDDNFLFSDPVSGRPTLYNPPGLDALGDIVSVGREVSQTVGGTLGATFAGLGGTIAGVPLGPPGMAAGGSAGIALGAGAGSAAGGSLFDTSMNLIAGRIDTRNVLETTTDTALDFAGGAVGQRAGELLGQGVKAAAGGGTQAAKKLAAQFRSLGIDPPAGAVTGSRAVGTVEKALDSSPFSSGVMQKQAERVLAQTKAAADKLARKFGPVQTQQGAGETIRNAAVRVAERFKFTQEKVYSEAFDLVGADTPVAVNSVTALREAMQQELAQAPSALKNTLAPAIATLRAIEADGVEGIPFTALRQIRTSIGRDIDSPVLSGSTGAQNEALKRIYGALTEDMSAAAQEAGPRAARKLAVADRFTRKFMNTAAQTMQKINNFEADEQAFRFAQSAARDGGTRLLRLRQNFTPEEWDAVAATTLSRMGLARAGAQDATGEVFSPSTFLTNWSKLSPEAKEVLFGGKRYKELLPELDRLVEVTSSLKGVESLTNTSNTARNMVAFSTIQTLGGALGGLTVGGNSLQSAAVGALGVTVAPRVAARLITSPAFVRWLTTPITRPNALSAHVGRLALIAVAEPELRDDIEQYTQALRSVPVPEVVRQRQ